MTLAGVANTLVHDGGRWRADNTDVPGAVAALRERWAGEVTAATVLGGGATAASTGLALADLGARTIRLLVRDAARAAEAVAALGRHPARRRSRWRSLDDARRRRRGGRVDRPGRGADAPTSSPLRRRCPVVFEVVYHPWPTPLAESVLGSGADRVLVTGLDLLVHQAALQFEQFTGRPASLDAMRSALP